MIGFTAQGAGLRGHHGGGRSAEHAGGRRGGAAQPRGHVQLDLAAVAQKRTSAGAQN